MEQIEAIEASPPSPPPPLTGQLALERLSLEAAGAYEALCWVIADPMVSGAAGLESWAAEYLRELRETGADGMPFFESRVLREIARHTRGPHQGYSFRCAGMLNRLARCAAGEELDRSMRELAELDAPAYAVITVWCRDPDLGRLMHAALWGKFDEHGAPLDHPPETVNPERVAEIVDEEAAAFDGEARATVAKIVAWLVNLRAEPGGVVTKRMVREQARHILAAWPTTDGEEA